MREDAVAVRGIGRALAALVLSGLTFPALSQTIHTVTLTTDIGVPGELRTAVNLANADGTDSIINFTGIALPATIILTFANGPLVITTENRTWVQGPGAPLLEIDANGLPQAFVIMSSGNAISGLSIRNTTQETIWINGAATNWIYGCYIGLDRFGIPVNVNQTGVRISNASNYNLVGTDGVPLGAMPGGTPGFNGEFGAPPMNIATGGATNVAERNVISDNNTNNGGHPAGVLIDSGSFGNRVAGNYIGTDPAGSLSIPNGDGVALDVAAENIIGISDSFAPNFVGGGEADEWNLISGNDMTGVLLDFSNLNIVAGNIIGPDVTGTTVLAGANPGNLLHGVHAFASSASNIIGTNGNGTADTVPGAPTGGERNLISNNGFVGVFLSSLSTLNRVKGNFIGVDVTGLSALPNGTNGVEIDTAPQNLVGTDADGSSDALETNVISGNLNRGVFIAANQALVWGNIIGPNMNEGILVPSNLLEGIRISGGSACSIGVDTTGIGNFLVPPPLPGPIQGNVISNNTLSGIALSGSTCTGNTVAGNTIGTDSAGTATLPNSGSGVRMENGASANRIGLNGAPPNVITHNGLDGVTVDDFFAAGTNANIISQNSITANTLLGIENVNNGNTEEPPPTVTIVSTLTNTVSGTTVAENGSIVEVFADVADEGGSYLGFGVVNSGTWSVTGVTYPIPPFFITATVTDTSGNTSEFSAAATPGSAVVDWMTLED